MTNGSSSTRKPARLGRGLSALVGTNPLVQVAPTKSTPTQTTNLVSNEAEGASGLVMALVDSIRPNPQQPRRHFDEASLEALAGSIGRDGVMQPVVVRPVPGPDGGGYELVAGERRLRASKMAGLDRIPAIVRTVDDRTSAELALIENLQRADLNPVDRARAFRSLVDRYAMTQADVAERVGMDRSSVANHLRLLDLGDEILEMVSDGRLAFGHARALLGISDPADRLALATLAAEESWSVRAVERAVSQATTGAATGAEPGDDPNKDSGVNISDISQSRDTNDRARAVLDDMERRLSEHLGTRVTLRTDRGGQKGSLRIEFFSLDEFDGLLDRLGYRHELG